MREFADKAHGNQKRKYTPERYIVHPERVMKICEQYTDRLPLLAAALLHDVLEDTTVTPPVLQQFLLTEMDEAEALETVRLVIELTDVYTKQQHPRWNRKKRKQNEVRRIAQTSGESQTVKYADIIDNCREIVDHDPEFARVFLQECKALLQVIPNGNERLYGEAVATVNRCLAKAQRSG